MSPKKKRTSKKDQTVLLGSARLPGDSSTDAPPPKPIIHLSGTVNIANGDIHQATTRLSASELKQLFDQIYTAIESRAGTSTEDREDLKAEVKEIQLTTTEAAQKNEKVDDGFLSRRFRNIARMAPDILDVVVVTLGNPLTGLGVSVKKIAEKAKVETRMPGDATTDAPPPEKKKKGKGK